jgi:GNAT superfamily N-acetyltransferase
MRRAVADDIPRLVEMGEAFHNAAQMPFEYDPAATAQFLAAVIDTGVVFVSEYGMIGGTLLPAYTNPDWVLAVELFWWASGGGLALLKEFENWAAEQGANEVRMTSLASLERADALLRRKGYAPAEISYRKVI